MALSLLALGVGAGKTAVFDGEPSSSFLLRVDGEPALLLDAGFGATHAALQQHRRLPRHVYISHNHSDHAGDSRSWGCMRLTSQRGLVKA
jgi:ribonuclease BN (tRNA processing enzyme)